MSSAAPAILAPKLKARLKRLARGDGPTMSAAVKITAETEECVSRHIYISAKEELNMQAAVEMHGSVGLLVHIINAVPL